MDCGDWPREEAMMARAKKPRDGLPVQVDARWGALPRAGPPDPENRSAQASGETTYYPELPLDLIDALVNRLILCGQRREQCP